MISKVHGTIKITCTLMWLV